MPVEGSMPIRITLTLEISPAVLVTFVAIVKTLMLR
jgi:hypothetical protein